MESPVNRLCSSIMFHSTNIKITCFRFRFKKKVLKKFLSWSDKLQCQVDSFCLDPTLGKNHEVPCTPSLPSKSVGLSICLRGHPALPPRKKGKKTKNNKIFVRRGSSQMFIFLNKFCIKHREIDDKLWNIKLIEYHAAITTSSIKNM